MRRTQPIAALLAVLSWPALSSAQSECDEGRSVRGPATEVRISSGGQVRLPTGETIKTPERVERWTYLADRRRITIVKLQAPAFSIGYPTTICEYDQAGRLTSLTFKLNGWTEHTLTTFKYDVKGRLIVRDTRSKDTEKTGTTTYEYGDATVTERSSSGAYTVKQLDAQGEVVKEVAHRQVGGSETVATTTYQRAPLELTTCGSGDGPAGCRTSRFDRWGNLLDERSGKTITVSYTYDIDVRGNWIKQVSAKYVDGKPPAIGDVTIREIVYRPQ